MVAVNLKLAFNSKIGMYWLWPWLEPRNHWYVSGHIHYQLVPFN